uniref:3 beta-hydroxysteroid dehydrogenase/Delta 5-->4-isomerase-like n=1 Tax=Myxine glutinosa TaxID=7769 RepID=UPI00358E17E2
MVSKLPQPLSVLVTGGLGFLGARLVRELLLLRAPDGNGHLVRLVRAMDLDVHCARKALSDLNEDEWCRVDLCQGDVRDPTSVHEACRGMDAVIHCAALIDVWGQESDEKIYSVNVEGTRLLLKYSILEGARVFVFTSSVEVTGPNSRGDPIYDGDEETQYEPDLKFPYSRSKAEAEKLVLAANGCPLSPRPGFQQHELTALVLRPMYIYGEDSRFLLYHMKKAVANKNVIIRSSLPTAIVNPIYVGNAAYAHALVTVRALQAGQRAPAEVGGKFYYVSDDTPPSSYTDINYLLLASLGFGVASHLPLPYALLYLYAAWLELCALLLRPFFRYVPPLNRQLLVMLNTHFTFRYKRVQDAFGYKPRFSWEESRTRTTAWLDKQLMSM